MQPALLALSVAIAITLVLTPFMRRLALATDLVDTPRDHKSHAESMPYLGGMAVIAGTLGASLLGAGRGQPVGLIVLAAAGLGVVGLLDDAHTLQPLPRLLAQLGAAAMVIAGGVRAEVTGIVAFDVALTLVWIIGVTNAVNFLDNMDGLAAGVTAAGATAAFVIAALNGQVAVATMAAALAGACLAFLVYNARPATIFMGDAGSLFIGFLLAAVTLEVQPELVGPPASFAIPLLLVAVPMFDITTVVVSRLRRRVPVSTAGRNHLSHRLVARGLRRGPAVAVLIAAEALAGALAVLVGAGLLPLLGAVAGTALVFAGLAAITVRTGVHPEPVLGFAPKIRLVLGAAVVGVVLLAAPAVAALVLTGHDVSAGADASELALLAARRGDAAAASRYFGQAAVAFDRAESGLGSPLVRPGLAVPVLNANLQAVRTVADVGSELTRHGERLTSPERLSIEAGVVPLDEVRSLAPELAGTASMLRAASARVAAADRPYLLDSVRRRTTGLVELLPEAAAATERAAQQAELAPSVLGGGGPRRYLVAIQDIGDPSPSGGAVTSWVSLVADAGRVRLERTGSTKQLSGYGSDPDEAGRAPDFASFAGGVMERYSRATGQPLDGVFAVDAKGLAALVGLTGPITVPGAPTPVGADGVARAIADGSATGGSAARQALLAHVGEEALSRLLGADLGTPGRLGAALGGAVSELHLRAFLARQAEQGLVERLGAGGRVPATGADYLMVATSDPGDEGGESLPTSARYDLALDPDGSSVRVQGTLDYTLTNDGKAPTGGDGTVISVFTPLSLERAALDGRAVPPPARVVGPEYSTSVPRDQRSSRTFTANVAGVRPLSTDGSYILELVPQPTLSPGTAEVSVAVPPGWRLSRPVGLRLTSDRQASGRFQLDRTHTISIQLRPVGLPRLWSKLRGGAQ